MPGLRAALCSVPSASSSSTHAAKKTAPASVAVSQGVAPSVPTPVLAASRAVPAFYAVSSHTQFPIRLEHNTDLMREGDVTSLVHEASATAVNYSSSGSPHDDPSTVCLAAMVHEFLEDEIREVQCGRARCNCVDGVCGDDEENRSLPDDDSRESLLPDNHLCEILEGITSCPSKPELSLLVDVARVVEAESEELAAVHVNGTRSREHLRRYVMKRLRKEGYNAAICKSRWNHGDGLPAGDYEYIDILMDGNVGSKKQERYIVDIDFRSQFEIARASEQYVQLLDVLPKLFVGRAERLKQILKIMSNAAKCSLKRQGLLLPPWRKHKYMQAKWFSSYRRTSKPDSSLPSLQCPRDFFGLGLRTPNIFSLDFTKEMDLLFYKAQAKGVGNPSGHHHHHHIKHQANGDAYGDVGVVRKGFGNDPCEYVPQGSEARTSAKCTDWQLPPVDEKCQAGVSRDKISGISSALKEQASLSDQNLHRAVAIVS